ncbi:MAG: GAF domain-containing protein [Desulfarculus sp.]|nr:GAF domain-containing protein [Desulfarculus sp.]
MPMLSTSKHITVPYDEMDISKRSQELAVLLELSNLLCWSQSLNDVVHNGLALVLKHMTLDAGRLYLMDDSGKYLNLAASLGVNTTGLKQVSLNEGFTGQAARNRQFIAQHVTELADKARVRLLTKKGFQVVICVPLIALDQVVGVLNLAARKLVRLTPSTIDLLIVMGNQIAVAANNARLNEELKEKAHQLEEQKTAIQFFAYTASHDLKSPAVGIFGLTQRLQKQFGAALAEKGQELCQQIIKAATRIESLTREINAYIAAKEGPRRLETVDLEELLEGLEREYGPVMRQRQIQWRRPAQLPAIRCERLALTRVLQNLLDNALKYGGPGLSSIEVIYRQDEGQHVLGVKDDGVGLDPRSAGRLFEAFQRGETAMGTEGTGLGLAIVREVARRHGGRAWLESQPGQGAAFFIGIAQEQEPGVGGA